MGINFYPPSEVGDADPEAAAEIAAAESYASALAGPPDNVDENVDNTAGYPDRTGDFVETDGGLLVAPEDLYEENDGGLYVLKGDGEDQVENTLPEPPSDETSYYPNGTPYDDDGNLNPGWAINPETGEPYFTGLTRSLTRGLFGGGDGEANLFSNKNALLQAGKSRAQAQMAIEAQRKQANNGDWRVKLRLAGGSDYLYNDPEIDQDGILYPLKVTSGVVFPYTPQIQTIYGANYSSYDLTHSNYRGQFYQNSYVGDISINATFTAQDTSEANYLLAVIHFFRSVTKMFYGQDAQRGVPPPLVFLQGLGEYQFNLHPCVVKDFNYTLPSDVDYIRANSVNINGTNLLQRRTRQTLPTTSALASILRLANAGLQGLNSGALAATPAPPTLGQNNPTYVPTKMEIGLILLPIQTRQQVSKQFSLKNFANGNLLKGGFW